MLGHTRTCAFDSRNEIEAWTVCADTCVQTTSRFRRKCREGTSRSRPSLLLTPVASLSVSSPLPAPHAPSLCISLSIPCLFLSLPFFPSLTISLSPSPLPSSLNVSPAPSLTCSPPHPHSVRSCQLPASRPLTLRPETWVHLFPSESLTAFFIVQGCKRRPWDRALRGTWRGSTGGRGQTLGEPKGGFLQKEAGCISWGSGLGAFLLVLRPPWGSSPFASSPPPV